MNAMFAISYDFKDAHRVSRSGDLYAPAIITANGRRTSSVI